MIRIIQVLRNVETNVDRKVTDGNRVLKSLRCSNLNKLAFAHLNINSIRNKFELLSQQVRDNVFILMVSETETDNSFPIGKFLVHGFSPPYRLNRDSKGDGIMLYIREDIPSNHLATDKDPMESLYVELNIRNEKYLINCSYNPHKTMIKNHLATLSNFLDLASSKYKKMLILGDFNVGIDEPHMGSFCETCNLTNLIKQPTCYKNPDNPTCIDLILTKDLRRFQSTCVIETGLSDFHLMTLMRTSWSFKHLSNEEFRKFLLDNLSNQIYVNNDDGFTRFCKISIVTLNSFAPIKNNLLEPIKCLL